MKKFSLLLILLCFLLGGCTITYSTSTNGNISSEEGGNTSTGGSGSSSGGNTSGGGSGSSSGGNTSGGGSGSSSGGTTSGGTTVDISSILNNPDIIARETIPQNALFYPNTLNANSEIINQYSYIYKEKASDYKIYSAYYSEHYDTLYIAYDYVKSPSQKIKAKDLYEIERHALNYFITDNNKSDYKKYLKAVLIYPDTLASVCREGKTDADSIYTSGCASYTGKEATINIHRMSNMEHFYNPQEILVPGKGYLSPEGMRYTYAHEFGHVSSFYNMQYKSDEEYEDYLKLRVGDLYDTIYPNGIPETYSSSSASYYTQPSEVLADDYVELFYDTSKKVAEDTYNYVLDQTYDRNSLRSYSSIHNLVPGTDLYNKMKSYYAKNFLDYSQRTEYDKPIVITKSTKTINYFPSYSNIGNSSYTRSILSQIDVNLIALGEVVVNGVKYYRVILSSTITLNSNRTLNKNTVGKKIGYVKASEYTTTTKYSIYKVGKSTTSENTIISVYGTNGTYIMPFYDFSYLLSLNGSSSSIETYDYLNEDIPTQKYKVSAGSLLTLVK